MIANDNGPPDGDYVRYIEGLLARAASAQPTGTKPQPDATHEKLEAHAMHHASPAVPTMPSAPTRPLDPTVADAMTRASVMRASAGDAASTFADRYHWLLGVAGLSALLYALIAPGINFIFVVIGIALVNGFVKLRKRARNRTMSA